MRSFPSESAHTRRDRTEEDFKEALSDQQPSGYTLLVHARGKPIPGAHVVFSCKRAASRTSTPRSWEGRRRWVLTGFGRIDRINRGSIDFVASDRNKLGSIDIGIVGSGAL